MKVVVIGAGQTGRGFIAPFLQNHHANITFVDKSESLIQELTKQRNYQVNYFGDERPSITICNYKAYHTEDPSSMVAIAEADVVTISIFANQIPSLVPLLKQALRTRTKAEKLSILCIENGVNVKQPLIDAMLDAIISEGIIFCTSIGDKDSLSITSEDYPQLPLDGSVEGMQLEIPGMPLELDFKSLIQRKIYTYNFLSAVICYLGSYMKYENYAEAANDKIISDVIVQVLPILNQLISNKYSIDFKTQTQFALLAVRKFENKYIKDSILRNAQQASRKLGETERLLMPLKFALEYHQPTIYFDLIIAAALNYGIIHEGLNVKEQLDDICKAIHSKPDTGLVIELLEQFQHAIPLEEIVDNLKMLIV